MVKTQQRAVGRRRTCASPNCNNRPTNARHGYCRKHAKHYDLIHPHQDGDKARAIITDLRTTGWTWQAIADAAGLSYRGVILIARGIHHDVHYSTMKALEAVHGEPPTRLVPTWPTARRVQSLMRAGHTSPALAELTGVAQVQLAAIAREEPAKVNRRTAEAVDKAFRQLLSEPVGTPTRNVKPQWVPPMWWDDIDDPDEQPGVSHCRDCHTPDPSPASGWCSPCRNRHYREDNQEEVRRRGRERYHRRKLKEKAA